MDVLLTANKITNNADAAVMQFDVITPQCHVVLLQEVGASE